jgi:hypothetical protein
VLLVGQQEGVPPGGSVTLEVDFSTVSMEGPIMKRFLVYTDAPEPSLQEIEFTLKAYILAYVEAVPSAIVFGTVKGTEKQHRTLRLRSTYTDLGARLRLFESDCSFVKARLVDCKPSLLTFDVLLDGNLPAGYFAAQLSFYFDIPEMPLITVQIRGQSNAGIIDVVPARLDLASALEDKSYSKKIRIQSRNRRSFRLISIEQPPGMRISASAVGMSSCAYDLTVLIDASRVNLNTLQSIILRTDNPEQPIVSIPVVGRRRKGS